MFARRFYQSIGEEEWSCMHESLNEVCEKIGVKMAGHRISGLGNLARRKQEKEPFFSSKKDLQAAFNERSL